MGAGHFQEYEEMYLKTLYNEHQKIPGKRVRNRELAAHLDVSPASATEMVQRLAKNGYVEYQPYKGVLLTDKGLELGKMMKRRHRLAETLLGLMPFEGDVYETACRLEHAFNDDLEVCISLILGNPSTDSSGIEIPSASKDIAQRISEYSSYYRLGNMPENINCEIMLLMLVSDNSELLKSAGLEVGSSVIRTPDGYFLNGSLVDISPEFADSIIVRSS